MAASIASAEVAADFRDSLRDLQANNRYEISNLTIIAKENAECAMAISRELENHIKTTPANRKLPALYVLDSIIKNVGTPYTLYLGRNLYSTFMQAYALVDSPTRKSMENMLKTWTEPVPGSLEARPVFPVDTTRPIETALAKARSALQQQTMPQQRSYHALPPRPNLAPQMAWRNTPTPPQNDPRYPPPSQNGFAYPGMAGMPQQQHPLAQQYPPAYDNQDTSWLLDLENLVSDARNLLAVNPYDTSTQTKLKALQDLQLVLRSQQLSPAQLKSIQDQVSNLTQATRHSRNGSSYQMPPVPIPPPTPQLYQTQPPPAMNPYSTPPPTAQVPMSSTNLAALLASADAARRGTPPVPQPTPPQQTAFAPALPAVSVPPPAGDTASLFAALTAAGLLTGNGATPSAPSTATPQFAAASLTRAPLAEIRNDVQLTAASLKIPRPHLVDSVYIAQPNQCTTCGRRFETTDAGRAKKAKHLDFHFRTNQRLADATKRGINRSWYIDELEWIRYREVDDGEEALDGANGAHNSANNGGAIAAAAKDASKSRYIRAPADAALAKAPCPICQDNFQTTWHDEAQEWVWMDAVNIGGRIYHASCHDEVSKDSPQPHQRPSSVLGKRKADGDEFGGSRLKREVVA